MSEEQRRFQRILHDANLQIEFAGVRYSARLMDLSLHGCLVHFSENLPTALNEPCTIHIQLSQDTTISADAVMTHLRAEDTAGFEFRQIDLDSIIQLRRMVELNLGDSELLERDMSALIHVYA